MILYVLLFKSWKITCLEIACSRTPPIIKLKMTVESSKMSPTIPDSQLFPLQGIKIEINL